jgi:acyl-CoA reductase-like NAD-dependent aldehyde dehydrogenase
MLDELIRDGGWFSKLFMHFAAAAQRQRVFFQSGATRSLEFRREQLRKLHDALETRESALIAALHSDLRKSPTEAYATEIGLLLSEIRHALRHLPTWMKPRRCRTPLLAWPARGFVAPEPYGVALILGPWNYPLQLLLTPLVGAMAAGNCAVIKPSEFAPHTAAVIAQFIGATFPEDYIAVVPGEAPLMQEEIFGPILPVLAFDRLEDVLGLLRDRPTPLALYLFSRNRKTQERVLAATRSGGVCINDTITHMVGKDLPFGGLGDSGLGAYHGRASFDCFTHRRSVMRRSFAFDPKLRYPPPRIKLVTLKRALRFLLSS